MSTYRSEAIILKGRDFKEYDRLLTIYTQKMGKIEVVARGVKKIQSKLAGHLQPFCLVDLHVARGKYRDRVAGGRILKNFNELKSNIEQIALANYLNETVDLLTRTYVSDQNTYQLIKTAYCLLDQYSRAKKNSNLKDQLLTVFSFLLRLLALQGFAPNFRQCFYCKRKIKEEKNFISFSHLSVVCPVCQNREKNLRPASSITLKVLRLMSQDNFSSYKLVNLTPAFYEEIQDIIQKLLLTVGEKELKSFTLIENLLH